MFKRPYLDASVYISVIKGPNSDEPLGHPELARQLFDEASAGKFRITASTWLAVEVHKKGKGPVQSDADLATIDSFLLAPYIDWVELDLPLALEARRLARKYGLGCGDATHLATAIRAGCDELLRWDGPWLAGIYEGVEVLDPYPVANPTLPFSAPTASPPTEPPPPAAQSPTDAPK